MKNSRSLKEESELILKGFEEVYRKLIIYKRKINSTLIIERDAKIIALDPFEAPDTISNKTKK
jgi:hypothetical protein